MPGRGTYRSARCFARASVVLSVVVLALANGAIAAQPAPIDQITNRDDVDVGAIQVGGSSRAVVPAPRPERETAPPQQLSGTAEGRLPAPQLTPRSERSGATPQLYRGGATAEASAPLSRPSEGRTGAVARVDGRDRCDAAAPRSGQVECARVIETRAAEFARAEASLSAEERLLAEQRAREQAASGQAAARRLAANAGNPDDVDDQAIASIVLNLPVQQEDPAAEAPAEELSPVLQAVVNALTNPQ